MKRLSGWDAVLLYSEAPNVHMHTLKVAVIELDAGSADFDLDGFRKVIGLGSISSTRSVISLLISRSSSIIRCGGSTARST